MKKYYVLFICILTIIIPLNSQTIFWSESGATLKSRNLATGDELVIFQTGVINPNNKILDLTLDTLNQKIYFQLDLSSEYPILMVVDYDGSNPELVNSCPSLYTTYNHTNGNVYYIDNNTFNTFLGCPTYPSIRVNNLDGTDSLIYDFNQSFNSLSSLRLDEASEKLYFLREDGLSFSRKQVNIDGTNMQDLAILPPFDGRGLYFDVVERNFYLLNRASLISGNESIIMKINETGTQIDTILLEDSPTSSFPLFNGDNNLFIDSKNDKLYYFWEKSLLFNPEKTQYFICSDLEGNNIDTLAIDEFGSLDAWTIDLSNSNASSELLTIEHHHNLSQEDNSGSLYKLSSCSLLDGNTSCTNSNFQVCADGTKSSVFKFIKSAGGLNFSDIQIDIFDDGFLVDDVKLYGEFSLFEDNNNNVLINYKHPNWMYETSNKFKDLVLNVSIGGSYMGEIDLRVWRAPVLLVHGWFANDESLNYLENYLISENIYNQELIHRIGYFVDSNLGIKDVDYFVLNSINSLLLNLRIFEKISAGSVDIVAHSTGGLLVRSYLQRDYYKNNIHKLITCNTPHSGTQWANTVSDENSFLKPLYCEFLEEFNESFFNEGIYQCNDKIVSDLKVNSPFISWLNTAPLLNKNKVPSHVITTNEPLFDDIDDIIGDVLQGLMKRKLKKIIEPLTGIGVELYLKEFVYNGSENDVFVPINSQDGGIQNNCSNCLTSLSGDHWDIFDCFEFLGFYECEAETDPIVETIKNKLVGDPEGTDFTMDGFLPNVLTYSSQNFQQPNSINLSVDLLSPTTGITVNYGDIIDINTTANSNTTDIEFYIESSNNNLIFESINSTLLNSTVDTELLGIGKKNIFVIANDSISGNFTVDKSHIFINPISPPDSIILNPQFLFLSKNQKYQLTDIKGIFNGELINISSSSELNLSSTTGIVTNDGNILNALEVGRDTIIVNYLGVNSSVFIEVNEFPDTVRVSNNEISNYLNETKLFKVYPSPTVSNINIVPNISLSGNSTTIEVIDILGNVLMKREKIALKEHEPYSIELPMLSEGIYYLLIKNSGKIYSEPIIG